MIFLTILTILCFIGCILEILLYIDNSCDYFNPLAFLILLIIGIFDLFAIFYMYNIK